MVEYKSVTLENLFKSEDSVKRVEYLGDGLVVVH